MSFKQLDALCLNFCYTEGHLRPLQNLTHTMIYDSFDCCPFYLYLDFCLGGDVHQFEKYMQFYICSHPSLVVKVTIQL